MKEDNDLSEIQQAENQIKNNSTIEIRDSIDESTNSGQNKKSKYKNKIEKLEQSLDESKKQIAEIKNKWLRTEADMDNFRKRTQKEKAEWRSFYHEEILEEILPVLDNFDRALQTKLEGEEAKKFAEGIILVDKQLHEILSKHGLNEIETVGKPFDPHFHEAVMVIETDEYPDNTVVEEIRKGFLREDKVIRPAMVKVAKAK